LKGEAKDERKRSPRMRSVTLFPGNPNRPVWGNALLRRKIILGTFVSLALVSFVGGIFVDYYFSQHNPRRPEPEVGRTYWVTADKVEVYVTNYELIAIRLPVVSFFIWFGAMFISVCAGSSCKWP
jgi:hypothetical protein